MPQDHNSFIIPLVGRTGVKNLYKNQIKFLGGNFIFPLKIQHICGKPSILKCMLWQVLKLCNFFFEALETAVFHKVSLISKPKLIGSYRTPQDPNL